METKPSTKICINCNKLLPDKRRLYCSDKCYYTYSHKNYYNLNKDKPGFKEKSRLNMKRWVENNREHFNLKMREIAKRFQKKKYKENILKGLCPRCSKPRGDNKVLCSDCKLKIRERYKKAMEKTNGS